MLGHLRWKVVALREIDCLLQCLENPPASNISKAVKRAGISRHFHYILQPYTCDVDAHSSFLVYRTDYIFRILKKCASKISRRFRLRLKMYSIKFDLLRAQI